MGALTKLISQPIEQPNPTQGKKEQIDNCTTTIEKCDCLSSQVPGEIGKINILRNAVGKSEIISTAFSHVKNAWQDDGVKFDKITLPINALVRPQNFLNIDQICLFIDN